MSNVKRTPWADFISDDEQKAYRAAGFGRKTPVPGLFAGGGSDAGISGRAGARGYASGNGLLTAIALGRLAGIEAARQVVGERA